MTDLPLASVFEGKEKNTVRTVFEPDWRWQCSGVICYRFEKGRERKRDRHVDRVNSQPKGGDPFPSGTSVLWTWNNSENYVRDPTVSDNPVDFF